MRYILTSFVFGLAGLGATSITALAQTTIADCEKIQAADAYNQCLAKFGPSGKNLNVEPERPGDVKASPEEAAAGAGKPKAGRHARGHHRGHGARHGGGRKRATFTVRRHK